MIGYIRPFFQSLRSAFQASQIERRQLAAKIDFTTRFVLNEPVQISVELLSGFEKPSHVLRRHAALFRDHFSSYIRDE